MSPLPCLLDLFVVTADQLERAQREQSPLAREALAGGLDLICRPSEHGQYLLLDEATR